MKINKSYIKGVYKITNLVNGKIYIGSSVNCNNRWNTHCWPKSKQAIDRAIQKYGKDNFKFEIIEVCSLEDLREREKYWMVYYNTNDRKIGYNIAVDTYYPFKKQKMSDKQRQQISDRAKLYIGEKNPFYGKHHSKETKKLLSEQRKGLQVGEKNPNYGKKHTKEAREKISKAGMKRRWSKKVKQIDIKTGEIIKIWDSVCDASIALSGKRQNHIGCVCRGDLNKTLGYKWEFVTEQKLENKIEKEINNDKIDQNQRL